MRRVERGPPLGNRMHLGSHVLFPQELITDLEDDIPTLEELLRMVELRTCTCNRLDAHRSAANTASYLSTQRARTGGRNGIN